jgi:hypothetical protein
LTNPPDGLDAVDARQHHVHQHRVEVAFRDPLGGGLAAPDEFRLVAEFGEDGIEHHAAERIVLDAENAQRLRRRARYIGVVARTGRFPRPGAGQRHRQRECGAAAAPLRHDDVAAHRARDLFHRRQSEPGATEARGDRDIGLRKRAEQALDLGHRQPDAAVGDREADADLALCNAHRLDRQRDAARFGEFDGIVDQVLQRGAQPHGIADHRRRKFFRDFDLGVQALRRGPAGERIAGAAGQRAQVEEILPHPGRGAAAACGIDKQGREAGEMLRARLDGIDPAPLALVEVGRRQQVADGENAGERRADLVRERGQRRLDHAWRVRRGGALARLANGKAGCAFFRQPALRRPRGAL